MKIQVNTDKNIEGTADLNGQIDAELANAFARLEDRP